MLCSVKGMEIKDNFFYNVFLAVELLIIFRFTLLTGFFLIFVIGNLETSYPQAFE